MEKLSVGNTIKFCTAVAGITLAILFAICTLEATVACYIQSEQAGYPILSLPLPR
mgnify:CR=1 FL=1